MPLERTPLPVEALGPAVARAVGAQTPAPARLMAARGLMPMGPRDLVVALYLLALDPDANVRAAAVQSVQKLPDKLLEPVLGEALDPRVLDFFAEHALGRRALIDKILLNPATDDETLLAIADRADESSIELLAVNEQRLLRRPQIIEAIYLNKKARMSTVDRLMELAIRNGLVLSGIPAFEEAAAALGYSLQADGRIVRATQIDLSAVPAPPVDPAQDRQFDAVLAEQPPADAADATLEQEVVAQTAGAKKDDKDQPMHKLSLSAKIRLASLGNSFHRSQLIRDSNKLVAMAVIKSPTISDNEVIKYSASRNVIEDVIAYIARRKQYRRFYQVKVNLVNNPKTPLAVAMKLLHELRDNDIRAVARSKQVPGALAKLAKQKAEGVKG